MSKSICFVALNSYNMFSERADLTHIGGAEVQQREVSSWLASKGFSVSFITKDHGQASESEIDGVKLYKAYGEEEGLPIVRFFHPRWSSLVAAMRQADADIYYQRGSGSETGQVGMWCKRNNKRFVYGCASEGDCLADLPYLRRDFERWFYRRGLESADMVIAQTNEQQVLLRQNFDIEAQVIRNVMRSPRAQTVPANHRGPRTRVLWAGRLAMKKRAEWLVDVANALPEMDFEIVGSSNADTDYATEMIERIDATPNITRGERLSRDKLLERYDAADAVLSTSIVEGFPNTFIESWYCGKPVVCTCDPDGFVTTHQLGWHGDTVSELVAGLRAMAARSPDEVSEFSARAQKFAASYFHPDSVLPVLAEQLRRLD